MLQTLFMLVSLMLVMYVVSHALRNAMHKHAQHKADARRQRSREMQVRVLNGAIRNLESHNEWTPDELDRYATLLAKRQRLAA